MSLIFFIDCYFCYYTNNSFDSYFKTSLPFMLGNFDGVEKKKSICPYTLGNGMECQKCSIRKDFTLYFLLNFFLQVLSKQIFSTAAYDALFHHHFFSNTFFLSFFLSFFPIIVVSLSFFSPPVIIQEVSGVFFSYFVQEKVFDVEKAVKCSSYLTVNFLNRMIFLLLHK